MALQVVTKVCTGCGKEFRTSNDSNHCYDCCLNDIAHGTAPEEGDFNTARIVSGTLSTQERRYLQSDLEQVECGMTTEEEWGVEEEPYDGPVIDDGGPDCEIVVTGAIAESTPTDADAFDDFMRWAGFAS